MSKKNKLLHVGILFTLIVFTFVGIILGIVAYSRSNKYFLKYNGQTVYCNSTIWATKINKGTDRENISLTCGYNKHDNSYKKWDGKYPKNYFIL